MPIDTRSRIVNLTTAIAEELYELETSISWLRSNVNLLKLAATDLKPLITDWQD